jgi:hypothetical protein
MQRITTVATGAHFVASGDCAREHATEREESALVGGGDHLRHVHHEGPLSVAVHHCLRVLVVQGSFIECCIAVLLRGCRGGQVVHHHLQQRVVCWKPHLQCMVHQPQLTQYSSRWRQQSARQEHWLAGECRHLYRLHLKDRTATTGGFQE